MSRLRLLTAVAVLAFLAMAPADALPEEKTHGPAWEGYESGLAHARKEGRYVIIDFYTGWCRDCKKMDKTTFADPGVVKKIKDRFVAVKVDGDKRPDLSSKHGIFGYPTFYILAPDGGKVFQRTGYMSREEFIVFMDYALTGAYKRTGYMEFLNSRKR